MKDYTYQNFKQLIDQLVQEYGCVPRELHENVVELFFDGIPVLRLIFDSESGSLTACFHLLITGPQAITLFSFMKTQYLNIELADTYYKSDAGELFIGEDADIAYEMDIENIFLMKQAEKDGFAAYIPKHPVSLVTKQYLYAASHPYAKEAYRIFKDRKKKEMWQ